MSGLILPPGYEQPPSLPEVDPKSCEMVRVASNILAGFIDDCGGPSDELGTVEGQVTWAYESVATGCGHACLKDCGLWVDALADKAGIEVPVSMPERARRNTVIRAVALGLEDDDFRLDPDGQMAKGIIERRLEMAPVEKKLYGPRITDEAYQQVATLAEGSHAQEIEIIGKLYHAAQEVLMGCETRAPLVIPADPSVITAADVRRLYLHPKMQYLLRIEKTPRSQIFSVITR